MDQLQILISNGQLPNSSVVRALIPSVISGLNQVTQPELKKAILQLMLIYGLHRAANELKQQEKSKERRRKAKVYKAVKIAKRRQKYPNCSHSDDKVWVGCECWAERQEAKEKRQPADSGRATILGDIRQQCPGPSPNECCPCSVSDPMFVAPCAAAICDAFEANEA